MENRCQPEVDWETGLVYPPHREIQCSPVTKNGCVDLAFPLLPRNGYKGQADEGGQCNNLGQPGKGMSVGANGTVYSRCKSGNTGPSPSSSRNHIEITIYSYCKPVVTGSQSQFLEQTLCLYTSQWNHAATYPVEQPMSGSCTVTNPASESTVNLTRLNKVGQKLLSQRFLPSQSL